MTFSDFKLKHLATGTFLENRPGRIPAEQSQSLYIMRGFAIIIVVIAHATDWQVRGLYFTMPLFFFLSGYLFGPPADIRAYLVSITRKMMVPYFVFLAIVSAPGMIAIIQSGGISAGGAELGRLLIGGETIKGLYAAFWYPPCFFFTHIAYSLCNRLLNVSQITLLCAPLFGLATLNAYYSDFYLPMAINVACMSVPILHAGRLYRERQFGRAADRVFHIAIISFGLAYTVLAGLQLAPGLQMKLAQYGWPVITVAASLCMIVLVKKVADRARNFGLLNLTLGSLGKASLMIMFIHQPVQMTIVSVLDIHHELFRIIAAVTVSYLVFRLIELNSLTSNVLLGKPRIHRALLPSWLSLQPKQAGFG